jgi:hypothetical protein
MGAMGGSVDRMEEAKLALPFLETGMMIETVAEQSEV